VAHTYIYIAHIWEYPLPQGERGMAPVSIKIMEDRVSMGQFPREKGFAKIVTSGKRWYSET